MDFFVKNRKCKCKLENGFDGKKFAICKHWDKEMYKIFHKRVDELWDMNLQTMFKQMNNMQIFAEEIAEKNRKP